MDGQQQGAEQGQPANEGGQPGEGQQGEQGQQGSQSGGASGEGATPTSEFADMLRNIANRKQEFLSELPDDTAGQVRKLQDYEFMDPEAQAKFNELVESLRQAMMNTFFKDLSEQIANMSPEDLERMKNMTKDLNQMIQDKMAGNEPDFDSFMQQYGDLFGDNPPQSLDELLAQMQQQMGQMQSLLGSLPGEMRQQLQDLLSDKIGDPRAPAGLTELAQNLEYLFPTRDQRNQYPFRGEEQLDLDAAMEAHAPHAHSRSRAPLEAHPVRRARIDIRRETSSRSCLARSRETLDELRKFRILEEAGYIGRRAQAGSYPPRHPTRSASAPSSSSTPSSRPTLSASTRSTRTASAANAPTTPSSTSSATRSTSISSAPS